MSKPRVVIFGASGGIGSAIREVFLSSGWQTIPIDSAQLNFDSSDSYEKISELLDSAEAQAVINSAGVFENGYQHSHTTTMNVNFGSNWDIVRYFSQTKNQEKSAIIVMVGSSSYNSGKQLYPLYSASKAALYNLWQSAKDLFENTHVKVHLINPVRTLTRMSTAGKTVDPELDYLAPKDVASKIFELVTKSHVSSCVDMTFKDKK